ncbi:MAG: endopeptidase La [Rickettsiales bacterium]|jgi:ATP-dependent Lon protease|nr:endopeptidase La [Rickettsiales bacterium]
MSLLSKKEEFLFIPLREMIIFPNATTIIVVINPENILAIEKAYLNNEKIFCIAQKNKDKDNIKDKDSVFEIGTICDIKQKINMPTGELRIFVRGIGKAKLEKIIVNKDNCQYCTVKILDESHNVVDDPTELEKMKKIVINKAEDYFSHRLGNMFDITPVLKSLDKDDDIIYILCNVLNVNIRAKQSILEENSLIGQYVKLNEFLEVEKDLINTENALNDKIDKKMFDYQKKFFLKEKLKFIKSELGNDGDVEEDTKSDCGQLRNKMKKLMVSDDVMEKFNSEIKKLEIIPTFSPEYSTVKNYLEWLVGLPWNKNDELKNNLKEAEDILNRDHCGLEEIKERIIEFLAVFQRTKKLSGPIICLVGPPGVGKTSLAKSIAEATDRKYVKISLGGIRDEAEIRGHRKTYVGAMPGKIIQSMKRVKTNNPLILLDEIDKMSSDFRGDPTSAMLEVLDPEQNHSFNDNFLEVEYDLSNVMFIATANSLQSIPVPLQDRMEIIKLSGYTEDEKIEITKKYLIRKQLENHGLKKTEFKIDDNAIIKIIRKYTFEAGVRNLERSVETIVRKATRKLVENSTLKKISINEDNLKDYLGVEKNSYNEANKKDQIGVSTGLAYTEFGGDLLYLEALKFDGSGKLNITGKLGDVMKESAEAAFSYVRSRASEMGITSKVFNKFDFHVHVPEGATPKDGPSAGVAISTALMSSLMGMKVRSDTAMTGEITLTGKVLPIGGLKEKLLAALRGNIKNVLIPKENVKDLEKIPKKVITHMKLIPIETIEEAFEHLLDGYKKNSKKPRKLRKKSDLSS